MIPIHDLYVFGCFGSGHQLFRPDQSRALGAELYDVERACDGTPVEVNVQVEGALVACTVPPGWSYVTWWDRQGDPRMGSHTGILARGTWSAEQLVTAARAHAPWAFRVPVQVAAVVVVADTLPVSAEAPAQRTASRHPRQTGAEMSRPPYPHRCLGGDPFVWACRCKATPDNHSAETARDGWGSGCRVAMELRIADLEIRLDAAIKRADEAEARCDALEERMVTADVPWRVPGCQCPVDSKPADRCDSRWTRCNARLQWLKAVKATGEGR